MIMTADITRILSDVRARCPGAQMTNVQAELFAYIRWFCSWTNVWTENIDVSIIPTETTYSIAPADGGRIIRLLRLYNSTDPRQHPVGPVMMSIPGTLVLEFAPTLPATWVARVAKTVVDPTDADDTPVIPAWITGQYAEAFTNGTLGRLMIQPAKPYSNVQLGGYHTKLARAEACDARVEALKANLYGGQVWRFPQSFNPVRGQRGA